MEEKYKIMKKEMEDTLKKFDKETRDKIKKAMALVKEVHEKPLREYGGLNPKFKRQWRVQRTKGLLSFAYDGTPDKGFVIIMPNYNVKALNQWGKEIKTFE